MSASADLDVDALARFVGLGADERSSLNKFSALLERALGPAVERLYSDVRRFAPAIGHFADEDHLERARRAQVSHWRMLLAGEASEERAARTKRIGEAHARIGLDHRVYLSGYAIVLGELIEALCSPDARPPGADFADTGRACAALLKVSMLDMSMVISAYLAASEAQSLEKSRFLASLAHDLRSPLHTLIGHAELAREDAAVSPETVRDLDEILTASRRLWRLVGGLLDLAKIEAGILEIAAETFTVAEFVRNAVQDIEESARRKDNAVGCVIDDETLQVRADPDRLAQVLSILLSNAVRFTRGGVISVHVRRAVLRAQAMVLFEIADTGVGMSQQQIASYFGEAIDDRPKRNGGSGLGLALARGIARRLGGELSVESAPGVGATFRLVIPEAPAAGPP